LNIRHILYPFDFSHRSKAAAPFVRAMAERFEARVTLMSVLRPIWDVHIGEPSQAHMTEAATLKKALDGALQHELGAISIERVVQQGDPASILVDYAHSHGCDLIMMPTHGVGPFRALLFGSVTSKVLHDAQCPVWTTPHAEDPEMREHYHFKSIVCPFDGKPTGEPGLRYAAKFARATGAALHIVHAVPSITDLQSLESERRLQEQVRQEAESQVSEWLSAHAINAPLAVRVGTPAKVACEEALHRDADLLIAGRGVLPQTFGRLRSQSLAILRESPCPVISV
jgi:nucleotide-binding universal stress UspA family protein